MKNIIVRGLILGIAFCFFCLIFCNKEESAPPLPPIYNIDTAIVDTTIYDGEFDLFGLTERTEVIDTTYDVFVVGSDYKGKNGLDLFVGDYNFARNVILTTDTLAHRTDIRVHAKNVNQNLGCKDNVTGNNGVETIVCNDQRIIDAVNAESEGLFYVDAVLVLANGKGHGSHGGGQIIIIGVGNHTSIPVCNFWEGFRKKIKHELGHRCGLPHENTTLNPMNDGVNGGCAAGDFFTFPQKVTITTHFDSLSQARVVN